LTIVAFVTLALSTNPATLFRNLGASFQPALSSTLGTMRLQVCIPLDAAATSTVPLSRFAPLWPNSSVQVPLPALQLSASVPMRGVLDFSNMPVQLAMTSNSSIVSSSSWRASVLAVYVEGMMNQGLSRVAIASKVTAQDSVAAAIEMSVFGDWDATTGLVNLQGSLHCAFGFDLGTLGSVLLARTCFARRVSDIMFFGHESLCCRLNCSHLVHA